MAFKLINTIATKQGTRLSGSIYCTKEEIDGGSCEPYLEMVMRSSFDKMVIQRKYKKFFKSISDIGGFADLILYGLWAFYYFYNRWAYHRWIRGQLVDHFIRLERQQLVRFELKRGNSRAWLQDRRDSLVSGDFVLEVKREDDKDDKEKKLFNSTIQQRKLKKLGFQAHVLTLSMMDKPYLLRLIPTVVFNRAFKSLKSGKKEIGKEDARDRERANGGLSSAKGGFGEVGSRPERRQERERIDLINLKDFMRQGRDDGEVFQGHQDSFSQENHKRGLKAEKKGEEVKKILGEGRPRKRSSSRLSILPRGRKNSKRVSINQKKFKKPRISFGFSSRRKRSQLSQRPLFESHIMQEAPPE